MKKLKLYIQIVVLGPFFVLFINAGIAQDKWLNSEEYLSIQKQSYNAMKSLEDLLNNIVLENQLGGITDYYEFGSPQQIFQDGAVIVVNDIKPKAKSYLTIEINSYLNQWYNHMKNVNSPGDTSFRISIENIFLSPVFLDGMEALSKVYYMKLFHYRSHTDTLQKFAIIRSSMQQNKWYSLISGIDLVNEKVMISEDGAVKKLQSVRGELGVLTETIKQDSTIISYNNFRKYITPYYTRTMYKDQHKSVYYFDRNLYICDVGNYNLEIKEDSMSICTTEITGIFHDAGFGVFNLNKGYEVSLFGDNKLQVAYPGFFNFLMNHGVATVSNQQNDLILNVSSNTDSLILNTSKDTFQVIEHEDAVIEVSNQNYRLDFHLREDRIEIKPEFSEKINYILTSNTKLQNMELIKYQSEEGTIESFYIDKNEVTVSEFAKFVKATGYLTEVEKRGWSFVVEEGFDAGRKYTQSEETGISRHLKLEKGFSVNWKCDEYGKMLNLISQDTSRPVIHVNYFDALQYCLWAGKQLPYRKEMNAAAKDLLTNSTFRNYVMFSENSGGKVNLVRQKLESEARIWDILGNVYEWCSDWDCDGNKQSCKFKYVYGGYWDSPESELSINKEKEVASSGSSLIGFRGVIRKVP